MRKLGLICLAMLVSSFAQASPVNVNTASAEQISKALNGIGLKKAQAIVDLCQPKGCHQPSDLLKVKGIGPKTLEKLGADILFSDAVSNQNNGQKMDEHMGH